jgi:U3 small nucleolar RNA-associated protein 5
MSKTVKASVATTGPVIIKGTTANLSVLKSIEDLDTFMAGSSSKELDSKFMTMIKEFQGDEKKTGVSSTMNKTQRGFSLSQILAQSLQNGDKQMLEAALCVSSAQHAKVLQVSLMRLPAAMVLPLLEAITKRLTLKPRRAMHLLPWLKNLLLCHAGYLSTIPSASKILAPLQQSIEERIITLNPMQKLAGRLELILKQAELRESVRVSAAEDAEMSEEPLAVYDESESEPETENELEYSDNEGGSDEEEMESDMISGDEQENDDEEMEEDEEEDDDDDDSFEDEDAEEDFE